MNLRETLHTTPILPTHTSLVRSPFQYATASNWNELQQTLKLDSFSSISSFKDSIMDTLTDIFSCFVWCIVIFTFLTFVLLTVPNHVCTMFCAATMLLPCCHVLHLSLCSVVSLVVLSYIYIVFYLFLSQVPSPA